MDKIKTARPNILGLWACSMASLILTLLICVAGNEAALLAMSQMLGFCAFCLVYDVFLLKSKLPRFGCAFFGAAALAAAYFSVYWGALSLAAYVLVLNGAYPLFISANPEAYIQKRREVLPFKCAVLFSCAAMLVCVNTALVFSFFPKNESGFYQLMYGFGGFVFASALWSCALRSKFPRRKKILYALLMLPILHFAAILASVNECQNPAIICTLQILIFAQTLVFIKFFADFLSYQKQTLPR